MDDRELAEVLRRDRVHMAGILRAHADAVESGAMVGIILIGIRENGSDSRHLICGGESKTVQQLVGAMTLAQAYMCDLVNQTELPYSAKAFVEDESGAVQGRDLPTTTKKRGFRKDEH